MAIKLVGSMAVSFNAKRQSKEFPAKASRDNRVKTITFTGIGLSFQNHRGGQRQPPPGEQHRIEAFGGVS
jgi:hypothetical protein